ncbi:ATP-binding protein [Nonomuraea sp. M3C6]|uniref:histidine kinase n=1 Tax=Nonomuraea marmarensis TaxID=3351344 RepID=A0ABW7AMM9_9ACTN
MRELLRTRFAYRLALAFAILGVGAAVLTTILVNVAFSARFDDYLADQQSVRERQLVAAFTDSYTHQGRWQAQALDELAPSVAMTGAEAELRDPAGQRIWSVTDAGLDPEMAAMHREMMGGGEPGPPKNLPIVADGRQVGTLAVRLQQGAIPAVDQDFRTAVNGLLAAGGVAAGLIALAAGLFFARRITAPVAELTRAADELAAGHRHQRATVRSQDEIGRLASSFNTMADQVEKEDELRRLFAADVAHELRTPLAILRSQIEAVQDGIAEPSPETIASLHEETLRLGRLVTDLEALASADAAAFTLQREPLALHALVQETVDGLAGQFAGAGITLHTDLTDVVLIGDAVRLRQIVSNLLTNARKFVPPGGTTTVTLTRREDSAELRITDTGIGIPPDELAHVFDRFFRGRAARAAGSGIGLAIVAELVAAHGGQVRADSEPGRGSTFTITLPIAHEDAPRTGRAIPPLT